MLVIIRNVNGLSKSKEQESHGTHFLIGTVLLCFGEIEPMAIPPAVKSQHQLQTESRAASTVLSRIMRENIGDSGRRQSESDDDSIRLKPLPDFSPEREQQPYNNHNVFGG